MRISPRKRPPGVFVQVGAGAGDQDSRDNFRDGFTEFVKSLDPSQVGKIVLVEPNPQNIQALRACWKEYPQAEIIEKGIRPRSCPSQTQAFYYADEDAPHFQVFSMLEQHVRKHYPTGTIRSIEVPTVTIDELLNSVAVGNDRIELLALDIEGVDAEILAEIDCASLRCRIVSFEKIHLGRSAGHVFHRFRKGKFIRVGDGLDVHGFDLMYAKPHSLLDSIQFRWMWGCSSLTRLRHWLLRR
jgi:FkbM family methyltransferase